MGRQILLNFSPTQRLTCRQQQLLCFEHFLKELSQAQNLPKQPYCSSRELDSVCMPHVRKVVTLHVIALLSHKLQNMLVATQLRCHERAFYLQREDVKGSLPGCLTVLAAVVRNARESDAQTNLGKKLKSIYRSFGDGY